MKSAPIAPFLDQIRSQASLIRHICIPFPTFDDFRHGRGRLHEAYIKNLELIRDTSTCTSIITLELSSFTLRGSRVAQEALDLLDARLKAIPSLKDIVNFRVYSKEVTKLSKKIWISDKRLILIVYNDEQLLSDPQRERPEGECGQTNIGTSVTWVKLRKTWMRA